MMKYNYNKNMKLAFFNITLSLFLIFGFFSCSRAEPKIAFGVLELVYYPGAEKPIEGLSFFILPDQQKQKSAKWFFRCLALTTMALFAPAFFGGAHVQCISELPVSPLGRGGNSAFGLLLCHSILFA